MIEIDSVSKRFGETVALDGVSLRIEQGEFFGLLGPNGAGKSTLLNILVGYLNPDAGSVRIGGVDVAREPMLARKLLGFVPQELALYDRLTALGNLEFFGSLYGMSGRALRIRAEELLELIELRDRRNDRVKTYSGGMKRRLNIAVSLMHRPSVLLCDEPTVGVDPQSRNAVFELLQRMHAEGMTVVYTTHYMEEAERLCPRIGIIDHGALIALGAIEELLLLAPGRSSVRVALAEGSDIDETAFSGFGPTTLADGVLTITPDAAAVRLSEILLRLEAAGVSYRDVRFDRPTLESLFLQLTGRRLRE